MTLCLIQELLGLGLGLVSHIMAKTFRKLVPKMVIQLPVELFSPPCLNTAKISLTAKEVQTSLFVTLRKLVANFQIFLNETVLPAPI